RGAEWPTATMHWEAILTRLGHGPLYAAYYKVPYGMVYVRGSKMKSSNGGAALIDDLLDRLSGDEEVIRLARSPEGTPENEELVRVIALGHFLDRPATKAVEFSEDGFLGNRDGPG